MPFAALGLTVGGLVLLFLGTAKASPLVFFGTAEERAGLEPGRQLMLVATVVLLVAAGFVAARAGAGRAVLVASPGVAAVALVYAFPKGSYAWLALIVLGPVALAAAVASVRE